MYEKAKERLESLWYTFRAGDESILLFAVDKVISYIKTECGVDGVPPLLTTAAVDMVVGEFLKSKKVFAPKDIEGLNLEAAVKQIQAGDTNVSFATEEVSTSEERLDVFINGLLGGIDESQLAAFRQIRW